MARAISGLTNGSHYVIDTSRNGAGPGPNAARKGALIASSSGLVMDAALAPRRPHTSPRPRSRPCTKLDMKRAACALSPNAARKGALIASSSGLVMDAALAPRRPHTSPRQSADGPAPTRRCAIGAARPRRTSLAPVVRTARRPYTPVLPWPKLSGLSIRASRLMDPRRPAGAPSVPRDHAVRHWRLLSAPRDGLTASMGERPRSVACRSRPVGRPLPPAMTSGTTAAAGLAHTVTPAGRWWGLADGEYGRASSVGGLSVPAGWSTAASGHDVWYHGTRGHHRQGVRCHPNDPHCPAADAPAAWSAWTARDASLGGRTGWRGAPIRRTRGHHRQGVRCHPNDPHCPAADAPAAWSAWTARATSGVTRRRVGAAPRNLRDVLILRVGLGGGPYRPWGCSKLFGWWDARVWPDERGNAPQGRRGTQESAGRADIAGRSGRRSLSPT